MHRRKGVYVRIVFILMFGVWFSVGCGRSPAEQKAEYYEVRSQGKEPLEIRRSGVFLEMQYCGGEPVQLWTDDGNTIYIARTDGSRELIMKNAGGTGSREWFVDREEAVYSWKKDQTLEEKEERVLSKLDFEGKEIHSWSLGEGMEPEDICQLDDGSIVMLLRDEKDGSGRLGMVDMDGDAVSLLEGIRLKSTVGQRHIAAGEKGLLVLDTGISEGLWEIDIKDGSRLRSMAFPGISQTDSLSEEMEIRDLRTGEDGGVEVLWADFFSGKGVREKLILTKAEKEVIRLRAFTSGSWLGDMVTQFNLSDPEYYILLEELPQGTTRADFTVRTSVELAAGEGPDILYGELLEKCFRGMAEKGVFADLTPFLEEAGIDEEDYFPFAFQDWRDGDRIYTVCASSLPYCYYVDRSILEKAEESYREIGIQTLVEALVAYPEEAYFEFMLEDQILKFFLEGSEDLWGMIDWEEGTCDFNNPLFAGMLEAAKRYSCYEGEIVGIPEKPFLAGMMSCSNLYLFDSSQELRDSGRVIAGVQFDDGCCAKVTSSNLAIVRGESSKEEGAWKFLEYLLQEDTQLTIRDDISGNWNVVPSNRAALERIIQADLADMAEIDRKKLVVHEMGLPNGERFYIKNKTYGLEDITEERIAEYMTMLEEARTALRKPEPIQDIIFEEARYYFEDVKSFEETAEVINNRVRLYIMEQ